MSLRWRWALTMAGVAALAIGLTAGAAWVTAHQQLRSQLDQELLTRVTFADRRGPGAFEQPGQPPGGPARGLVGFDAVVQLIDTTGAPVLRFSDQDPVLPVNASELALTTAAGEPVIRTVEIDGVPYRMITAHVDARGLLANVAAVQVAVDISREQRALAGLGLRLLTMGIAGVLLVALTGWLLAGRAVLPIERLTATAEEIARTERLDADLHTEAPGEIGRLASAFRAMLESLSDSRRQQQRLISDAGHEFRTPLTALKTNLETLSRAGDRITGEQRDQLIGAALTEADELATLSGELVDLATDVRHSVETPVRIELDDLVASVVARFSPRHPGSIAVSGTGAVVEGRRSQLERALANLLDNAVKWSPPGAPIEVRVDDRTVEVRDHGPGIPEEDLPLVFERFHRSVEARTTPGSGLGLSIVEHIVSAHGGTVFARNADGGGAVVGFRL